MKLQIKYEGASEWGTLATANPAAYGGVEKAVKYLVGQRQDWISNGGPKFLNAQYRIGDFKYGWDGSEWQDYYPEKIAA